MPSKKPGKIYVASRASVLTRGAMWRAFRDSFNLPIISSWIDEDGEGESESLADLWERVITEVAQAETLVLYAETDDFPLKGALIEVGAALGLGKPIVVCLPGVILDERSCRPVGSWINHPLVTRIDDVFLALGFSETCPDCRHREHGDWCPNMASDNDCGCTTNRLSEKSILLKDWVKDVPERRKENAAAGNITGTDLATQVGEDGNG